jgi:hypothetical protein
MCPYYSSRRVILPRGPAQGAERHGLVVFALDAVPPARRDDLLTCRYVPLLRPALAGTGRSMDRMLVYSMVVVLSCCTTKSTTGNPHESCRVWDELELVFGSSHCRWAENNPMLVYCLSVESGMCSFTCLDLESSTETRSLRSKWLVSVERKMFFRMMNNDPGQTTTEYKDDVGPLSLSLRMTDDKHHERNNPGGDVSKRSPS